MSARLALTVTYIHSGMKESRETKPQLAAIAYRDGIDCCRPPTASADPESVLQ